MVLNCHYWMYPVCGYHMHTVLGALYKHNKSRYFLKKDILSKSYSITNEVVHNENWWPPLYRICLFQSSMVLHKIQNILDWSSNYIHISCLKTKCLIYTILKCNFTIWPDALHLICLLNSYKSAYSFRKSDSIWSNKSINHWSLLTLTVVHLCK